MINVWRNIEHLHTTSFLTGFIFQGTFKRLLQIRGHVNSLPIFEGTWSSFHIHFVCWRVFNPSPVVCFQKLLFRRELLCMSWPNNNGWQRVWMLATTFWNLESKVWFLKLFLNPSVPQETAVVREPFLQRVHQVQIGGESEAGRTRCRAASRLFARQIHLAI